jgi:hypothetical protein
VTKKAYRPLLVWGQPARYQTKTDLILRWIVFALAWCGIVGGCRHISQNSHIFFGSKSVRA